MESPLHSTVNEFISEVVFYNGNKTEELATPFKGNEADLIEDLKSLDNFGLYFQAEIPLGGALELMEEAVFALPKVEDRIESFFYFDKCLIGALRKLGMSIESKIEWLKNGLRASENTRTLTKKIISSRSNEILFVQIIISLLKAIVNNIYKLKDFPYSDKYKERLTELLEYHKRVEKTDKIYNANDDIYREWIAELKNFYRSMQEGEYLSIPDKDKPPENVFVYKGHSLFDAILRVMRRVACIQKIKSNFEYSGKFLIFVSLIEDAPSSEYAFELLENLTRPLKGIELIRGRQSQQKVWEEIVAKIWLCGAFLGLIVSYPITSDGQKKNYNNVLREFSLASRMHKKILLIAEKTTKFQKIITEVAQDKAFTYFSEEDYRHFKDMHYNKIYLDGRSDNIKIEKKLRKCMSEYFIYKSEKEYEIKKRLENV